MKCHDGVPLPLIVRKCIDYVEENGLCMEGIYRVSAAKSRLDDLEEQINKSHVVELSNVHEATGLLKRYVRQLPENVLTQEMRGTFEEIAAKCPCRSLPFCRCLQTDILKAQLSRLPEENFYLLAYIFLHSQRVIYHKDENKMGVGALGLLLQAMFCVSQTLIRIFLLNASDLLSRDKQLEDASPAVFLFSDVKYKRSVFVVFYVYLSVFIIRYRMKQLSLTDPYPAI
ncbi:hypothetical protein AB6A40_005260 [Gnathostoma spinigerum]|uniref:Rho-GAP domain-containing protein n=1 Tax=Gnathostoma spinigerum TaxID=75299 RepID=A0ABD6EM92_9BILA